VSAARKEAPAVQVPVQKPLHWFVEDFALYPREKIDEHHVREIADAIRAGSVMPPLVAEQGTGRIVDGWHRRRAHKLVHGDQAEVPAILKVYADDTEALKDAVRYNAAHGRRLSSGDRTRAANMLHEAGVDDRTIGYVLLVPESKVVQIRVRVAPVADEAEAVTLKAPVRHLQGVTLTQEQATAARRAPGVQYVLILQQVIDAAEQELFEPTEPLVTLVQRAHTALGTWLRAQD
jgi:ParB-like chromosome segregation protein Spo0J